MDQEERRQFWDVLCSLQGTDVQSESEELSKIPSGVILGLKVADQNRDIIIRASKMAGVDHIYESYINDKYKIDHREIQC